MGNREKSPLAKTVRTARELLKLEAALWTFVYVPGVEPTNNAAERALRTVVIWRQTSFGSQFQAGSEFAHENSYCGDIPQSTAAKSEGLSHTGNSNPAIRAIGSIPITTNSDQHSNTYGGVRPWYGYDWTNLKSTN
ncbi:MULTISPECIES: transposase [unclassified Moorena]|uniref:IS66 family transposase n=1 Tax=unclassified Moorena TaxID=2683338 RepID=UPI00257DA91C|nr:MULTISPECIES: transposase [unclassified Moorena]